MNITGETVRGVAELAHLRLTEAEIPKLAREMEAILTHIEKMSELDTSDVPPMAQVLFAAGETATLRADAERAPLSNEAALLNAPLAGGGFFKVPKVIER